MKIKVYKNYRIRKNITEEECYKILRKNFGTSGYDASGYWNELEENLGKETKITKICTHVIFPVYRNTEMTRFLCKEFLEEISCQIELNFGE